MAQGEAEWAALEAEITIGETFFFRYAEQFAALGETILPALLERARPRSRLRIWSAGCASGAEPYSVAILLRRLLGEALPDWRLSILGTDLNEAVLETARQARFSRWALRTLSPEELQRDFIPAADGRHWLLRPQHRAMVRFEKHNLLSLLDGTSPLQFTDYDLILCRNVLIYFHPEVVLRIVRALSERLHEGAGCCWAMPSPTRTSPSSWRS
ncbi:CheR family methyltransferase [Teichococcus aestuarii]|uniref:CheR family methyltransferase n=1 Tax=Teichococcus aestuarii TaxID=568898 RepID=UPI00361498A6